MMKISVLVTTERRFWQIWPAS